MTIAYRQFGLEITIFFLVYVFKGWSSYYPGASLILLTYRDSRAVLQSALPLMWDVDTGLVTLVGCASNFFVFTKKALNPCSGCSVERTTLSLIEILSLSLSRNQGPPAVGGLTNVGCRY